MNNFITIRFNPGGENESGNGKETIQQEQKELTKDDHHNDENKEHKTVMEKIKEALHDWSNKDEQDQAFDDTRV